MARNRAMSVVQLPTVTGSNTAQTVMIEVPDVGASGKIDVYAKVTRSDNATATVVLKGTFFQSPGADDLFAITQATTNPGTGTATVLLVDGQPNKYSYMQAVFTPSGNDSAPTETITAKLYIVTY